MIAPYNCVVVANGSFPQTALPLRLLHEASVVIACDGAVEALDKAGIIPTAIVGDLDSIRPLRPPVRATGSPDLRGYRAARRPYVRQYLPADGLRPAVPPGRDAIGLWDLHPYPANDNTGQRARNPSVPFLPCPIRQDFDIRTALAHPQSPADLLVARHIKRSDRQQLHRHPLTGRPDHSLPHPLNNAVQFRPINHHLYVSNILRTKKVPKGILRSAFGTKYTLNFTT